MKTTDLIDRYEDALVIANVSNFTHFGRTREFHGRVVTVQSREDNTKAKALLETPGQGRVLVVDGAASYARALMGDNVAAIAIENGWQGVVINGYLRDSADINRMALGVLALGATPRRPKKENAGEIDVTLQFAGVEFVPGHYIYVDEDGLLLSSGPLDLPE